MFLGHNNAQNLLAGDVDLYITTAFLDCKGKT